MNLLFLHLGTQEILVFVVVLFYGFVISAILWGVYKILSVLQNRQLAAKGEHTTALLQQSEALREIASAIRESNNTNNTPQEKI